MGSIKESPPSTAITCPVIQFASSAQSSATTFPISAVVPSLPNGVQPLSCQASICFFTAGGSVFSTLSSIPPGLMALTVMRRFARATAK